jgi:hypothetical protein
MAKELDASWLEILKALEMVENTPSEPIEYRLHYNEDGDVYMCSMQQHPVDTSYIVVTKDEYDNYFRYRVINSKLKMIDNNNALHVKLKSSDQGYAAVKNHAGIILEQGETADTEYWSAND